MLALGAVTTAAVRELTRSDEERAVEASLRELAAREALVREASAFCRHEIMKQRGAGEIDPVEERLGYEPVTGVAYVVGELTTHARDGSPSRHEYVCRLKRTGSDWLALIATIR